MRVLLDECVLTLFARYLTGHEVRTVRRVGWVGIKNGRLLALTASRFDVFLTVDRSIEYQQQLPRGLSLVTVLTTTNRLNELVDKRPRIQEALSAA